MKASEIRGAMVVTSIAIARELNKETDYFAALSPAHREQVRLVVPQDWIPVSLAIAHYEAMEAAFPMPSDQVRNGRIGAARTQKAYVSTIIRMLGASGTVGLPAVLKRLPSVVDRMARGGGSQAVYRTGPKDLRVELEGYEVLRSAYARNGWQGMFEGTLSLIAPRLYVRQDTSYQTDSRMALSIAWV
jgi:hypothetical protein